MAVLFVLLAVPAVVVLIAVFLMLTWLLAKIFGLKPVPLFKKYDGDFW